MNTQLEHHYTQYLHGLQSRLKIERDEAQDFLHQVYLSYVDPQYYDQFKYDHHGQLVLFDQYLIKRTNQYSRREVTYREEL